MYQLVCSNYSLVLFTLIFCYNLITTCNGTNMCDVTTNIHFSVAIEKAIIFLTCTSEGMQLAIRQFERITCILVYVAHAMYYILSVLNDSVIIKRSYVYTATMSVHTYMMY